MSQRVSGYARKEHDCYETPAWVTEALIPHIPARVARIWEPACGSGKIVDVLKKKYEVIGTDLPRDFFTEDIPCDAIITNPPYENGWLFVYKAFTHASFIAMLFRTDFDHAKGRAGLFERSDFAKKLVLRKRIVWFERPGAAPSFNHAWFIWDKQHNGAPTLAYAA